MVCGLSEEKWRDWPQGGVNLTLGGQQKAATLTGGAPGSNAKVRCGAVSRVTVFAALVGKKQKKG